MTQPVDPNQPQQPGQPVPPQPQYGAPQPGAAPQGQPQYGAPQPGAAPQAPYPGAAPQAPYPGAAPQAPYPGAAPQGQYPGQYPGAAPQAQQYYAPGLTQSEENTWSMFAHLGGILLSWLVPLIIFFIYKDKSIRVKEQSKEALNFQITIFIVYVGSIILMAIGGALVVVSGFFAFISVIAIIAMVAFGIASLVFGIMGAVKCYGGADWRYPIAIRLIK